MLKIIIPKTEIFDEDKETFTYIKRTELILEHSLLSISKWESKWMKPFLDNSYEKTEQEILDYIRCMSIREIDSNVLMGLRPKDIESIVKYIDSPMTASTVTYHSPKKNIKKEKITSELIYYWMIVSGIPFECEKWHLNRLLMLIKIFGAKNSSDKKMSAAETAKMQSALNAKRRSMYKSKG